MAKVIGIDLGTTNSAVAVVDAGFPMLLANQDGKRLTPSVVHFDTASHPSAIGEEAARMGLLEPAQTVYSVKRFMGRRFEEVTQQEKEVHYPLNGSKGQPIKVALKDRCMLPEEVAAEILKSLKKTAEIALECSIEKAVITVPAYFNDAQRQATMEAGRLAGLQVERIINEPTAAALAYGLNKLKDQARIAVYDLGGGTFDITILELNEGVFRVLSTQGNTCLGGDDLDQAILDHFLQIIGKEVELDVVLEEQGALPRLREAAQKAKIALSTQASTAVKLPFLGKDFHFNEEFTREQLEQIALPVIDRTRPHCVRAMHDAGLETVDLDQVLLVGGQTRMPLVRKRVNAYFKCSVFEETRGNVRLGDTFHTPDGPTLNTGQNPDEAVALGAAIQGAILSGEIKHMTLLDVTPLSLGIETFGGLMNVLIPRNSTIPIKAGEVFTTAVDRQEETLIHVLQGEREKAADNWSLGRFMIPFENAPKGVPRLGVQFEIDANGVLNVLARDIHTGNEQILEFKSVIDVEDATVTQMVESAVEHAMEDLESRHWIENSLKAKTLLKAVKQSVDECSDVLDAHYLASVLEASSKLEGVLARENTEKRSGDTNSLKSAIKNLDEITQELAHIQLDRMAASYLDQEQEP